MTSLSIPTTFKAFEFETHSADVLSVVKLNANAAHKPLEPTQLRIKVLSAAINPLDYKLVPRCPPFLPKPASTENPLRVGFDLAGVVVELGPGVVDGFTVGDAVFATAGYDSFGSFAEYINLDAKYVAPKPANMSFDEAASVPLVALTSYQALFTHGKVAAGQRVLILDGAGSTGLFAIQMAKAAGAYVIATASARNTALVTLVGADEVVDYTRAKWSEVLPSGSIDVIYDAGVEPAAWEAAAQKVLKLNTGAFVTLGLAMEASPSPIGADFRPMFVQPNAADLRAIGKLIAAGAVKTVVNSVFPLDEALEALERQMSGRASGKIILHVADP